MSGLESSAQKVLEIAKPLAHTMGFEVLLIEEVEQDGVATLRIFLDKNTEGGGIGIDDCAGFSRALDPILDMEADLRERYRLEVSSPGVNRPLVSKEHFRKQVGAFVNLTTRRPLDDRRHFKGILKGFIENIDEDKLLIEIDGREFMVPFDEIKRANLDYFLSEELKNKKQPIRFRKKKG